MNERKSKVSIGILGHVGTQNLGDEAIIAAVIANIRRYLPHAEIRAYTVDPQDTQARHSVPAFPLRRLKGDPRPPSSVNPPAIEPPQRPARRRNLRLTVKDRLKRLPRLYAAAKALVGGIRTALEAPGELLFWMRCYRRLKGINLLVVAGSHQLMDYIGGPWSHPYTLWRWCLLARLVGAKVAFLSVGAGPIHTSLGRFLLKRALALASYRSYRDDNSRKEVARMGIGSGDPVRPDLAYSLPAPSALASDGGTAAVAETVVAINPMPLFRPGVWHDADISRYEDYLEKLAAFSVWLTKRGCTVLLLPTQLRADPPVIKDLRTRIEEDGHAASAARIVDCNIRTFDELMHQLARAHIVVATRYHGTLLATLLEKPTLCISYHKKARELMEELGQGDFVQDIESLDLSRLKEQFILLEGRKAAVREQIRRQLPARRRQLETQYKEVFRFLEDGKTRTA